MQRCNKIRMVIILLICLFSFPSFSQSTAPSTDSVKLSQEEIKLYKIIMQYRKEKKLPSIPLSVSMTKVAQTHAKDLQDNGPDKNGCNMHSWSQSDKWKGCCYTPDHKEKQCMWSKPSELTNYKGFGFEIAASSTSGIDAQIALSGWKSSPGHNGVIINKAPWKQPWKSVGVAIYGNYSVVWFGMEEDPEGVIKINNER